MRELTFIGPLTGSHVITSHTDAETPTKLLLIAEDGTEFQLPIDQRLVSIVTREFSSTKSIQQTANPNLAANPTSGNKNSHSDENGNDTLQSSTSQRISPRDIQNRVRAGETAQEIVNATGADASYVERFASQVLAECEQVVASAAWSEISFEGTQMSFEQAINRRLRILGVKPELVQWQALKGDKNWSIVLSYRTAKEAVEAWFSYVLGRREITPANEEAQWLLAQPHGQQVEPAHAVTTKPITTQAPIQPNPRPTTNKFPESNEASSITATPLPARHWSAQWDALHPAAKAQKRREAANDKPATANREIVLPESASATPKTEPPSSASPTIDDSAQTSPEWEELLFGTPPNEHDGV